MTEKEMQTCPECGSPAFAGHLDSCSHKSDKDRRWENELFIKTQFRDPFEDHITHLESKEERRAPTEEEKRQITNMLTSAGKLFEGCPNKWLLDGALNISLLTGGEDDFIGVHKDIDISVEADELDEMEKFLITKGYAFFNSTEDPLAPIDKKTGRPSGKKMMTRIHGDEVAQLWQDQLNNHPSICAIDDNGKLIEDSLLNMIDLHIIDRNEQGHPMALGVEVPDKWMEPIPTKFHDVIVERTHPATVAFFKIFGTRDYDLGDLKHLAKTGALNDQDLHDIHRVIVDLRDSRKKKGEAMLRPFFEKIRPGMSPEEIISIFESDPIVGSRFTRPSEKERFERVAKAISDSGAGSVEEMFEILFSEYAKEMAMEKEFDWFNQLKEAVEKRNTP